MSSSPRPNKRRRVSGYISPLPEYEMSQHKPSRESCQLFDRAAEILRIEAEALANVALLYKTSNSARQSLSSAVDVILDAQRSGAKLIVCGVGKSAYIGMKLVATCKSLGVGASFMHACEAMHGDLGDVRAGDVLLFVSFSGKTPELLNMLAHIPTATRTVAISAQRTREECHVLKDRADGILLPAPILEDEERSFGVKAPTTSTTVALAVADMLALTLADQFRREETTKEVFKRNHPGGAIGISHREIKELKSSNVDVTVVELPSPSISSASDD